MEFPHTEVKPSIIVSEQYYSRKEAAILLGLKVSTLEKWATLRMGPNMIKVGRLVRYQGADLQHYLESRKTSFEEMNNG
jgi:predicted DNA-binding transcriptional regulator AlpA